MTSLNQLRKELETVKRALAIPDNQRAEEILDLLKQLEKLPPLSYHDRKEIVKSICEEINI